jgi:hypothetical protein
MTRLRRGALISAALAAPVVLTLGALMGYQAWRESHWHPDDNGGVTALAFSPDRRILVSAAGYDINGTDTVWNIARPAHPKQLAQFEGGSPTALSPDGRTVATISFRDQPVLWNVSNPERPAKIAALPGLPNVVLWGQAFSPRWPNLRQPRTAHAARRPSSWPSCPTFRHRHPAPTPRALRCRIQLVLQGAQPGPRLISGVIQPVAGLAVRRHGLTSLPEGSHCARDARRAKVVRPLTPAMSRRPGRPSGRGRPAGGFPAQAG